MTLGVHDPCRRSGDRRQSREAVTTVERFFVDERPSTQASACPPAALMPAAHADVVGQRPVRVQTQGGWLADQGISVSAFGLPGTSGISNNYSNTGTTSANGEGMATAHRDQKVQSVKARGIPPRGRPV